jgi:hypothetical protein
MVGIQYEQLALHTDIHILSGNSFQVIGHIELDTNTLQAVTKNLPYRIEVPGKLVHIGRCAVPLWHNKDKSENPCVATGWRFVLILFPLKKALEWGLREGVKN